MERVLEMESAVQLWDVLGNHSHRQREPEATRDNNARTNPLSGVVGERREEKWNRLTESICTLLDDFNMVGFVPLNINDEDNIAHVLATVDHAIQYGEDLEVRGADYDDDVGEIAE